MADFDPVTVLKNLCYRTPTRPIPPLPVKAPEVPPRPETDASISKVSALEVRVRSLETSLTQKTESEAQLREANIRLKDSICHLKKDRRASENQLEAKVKSLQEELDCTRQLTAQLRGQLSTQALKADLPKPPNRTTKSLKQQDVGEFDLGPLVEHYKRNPNFPRPMLQIDFSPWVNGEVRPFH